MIKASNSAMKKHKKDEKEEIKKELKTAIAFP